MINQPETGHEGTVRATSASWGDGLKAIYLDRQRQLGTEVHIVQVIGGSRVSIPVAHWIGFEMGCEVCGKREATETVDLDRGDAENGPRPEITEVCSTCCADLDAAIDAAHEEAQRDEAGFYNEVGARAYNAWQGEEFGRAIALDREIERAYRTGGDAEIVALEARR